MASSAQGDQSVIAKVKMLINTQLKTLLKREGLPVSGVKATMQERIITQVQNYQRDGNWEGLNRLKALINDPDASVSLSPVAPRTLQGSTLQPLGHSQYMMTNGSPRPRAPPTAAVAHHAFGTARPNFKDSPFYTVLEPLTSVMECKGSVRESTRDQIDGKITLTHDVADRLKRDPTLRAMVYCASDPISSFSKVDVSFPYQFEIKINNKDVKANFRGLKNKPGSTRPADLTELVKKLGAYDNLMTITYALTQKRFFLVVNLVKQHFVHELVAKLESGKTISKEQVVREMISRAQDNDIVATSSIMSLKCPLSTLRIDVPCRSTVCSHNQCFDASSFLQLQEQAPTWTCPVCNKIVNFEALEVDQYVNDILKSTPRSVDQVTIEPDGKWLQTTEAGTQPRPTGTRTGNEDDEDLIEIGDIPRVAAVKSESTLGPGSTMRTPPTSSREQSTSSIVRASAGSKRPIDQVIDLTFSSDEDDQPPRAPKRQSTQVKATLYRFPSSENTGSRTNGANAVTPKFTQTNPLSRPNSYTNPS